jgi:hypothetical protein
MSAHLQIVAILGTLGLLVLVLELVRRRRLLERYALVWLGSALVLLALGVWKGLLTSVSNAIGIAVPSNALFAIAFGFVLLLLLHFSIAVSRLTDQTKVLAQRLALIEQRQRDHERESDTAEAHGDASRSERDGPEIRSMSAGATRR